MRAIAVTLTLLCLAPIALASTAPYSAHGTYDVSGALLPKDACVDPTLQGTTSTCNAVLSTARGHSFRIVANSLAGTISGLRVCTYTSAAVQIACFGGDATDKSGILSGGFASNAATFSTTSVVGAQVSWSLSLTS